MTQFELFCTVFYAIDAIWWKTGGEKFIKSNGKNNEVQNEDLRMFLSDANPFLWAGEISADPAMYEDFREIITQENIPIEESYDYASQYIDSLTYYYADGVLEAFRTITRSEWDEGVNRYMSSPHK